MIATEKPLLSACGTAKATVMAMVMIMVMVIKKPESKLTTFTSKTTMLNTEDLFKGEKRFNLSFNNKLQILSKIINVDNIHTNTLPLCKLAHENSHRYATGA